MDPLSPFTKGERETSKVNATPRPRPLPRNRENPPFIIKTVDLTRREDPNSQDSPTVKTAKATRLNDFPRQGRLLGWQAHWPPGWPRSVTISGLKWKWGPEGAPPLRITRPHRRTSPSILLRIKDLLSQGVIERVHGHIFLNRLFEVPKKDSNNTRLVLDVSRLNKFIPAHKFRMTTVDMVRQTLRPGWFMASVDLKDAYWHIPIHPRFRPYLAFSAGQNFYQFRVLPFGLNIAPRMFTLMLKPVHARLAALGVQVLMYLDDWLILAPSADLCNSMVSTTLRVGTEMGLQFNLEKSQLTPTRSIQWLGMVWDSTSGTVSLSKDNQQRCRQKLFRTAHCTSISKRQWESLMGSLNHAAAIVPLGRLHTRRLLLESSLTFRSVGRDTPIPIPQKLQALLSWWTVPARLNHPAAWTTPPPSLTLTTDASDAGWGFQSSSGHQGQGTWTLYQRSWHINIKELHTVLIALSAEPTIRDVTIQILSDNSTTVHCINKQGTSRSRKLQETSEALLELAHQRNLSLQAAYLRGVDNSWADALSRDSTLSIDWSLTPDCFADICKWAGTPEIDLFASHANHLLPRFISLTHKTQAGGPDAFRTNWNRWNFIYLFPPPNTRVLLQVANRLEVFRGRALLIAPWWETQPWFPTLLRLGPRTLDLPAGALRQESSLALMTSLRLTAWDFSAKF